MIGDAAATAASPPPAPKRGWSASCSTVMTSCDLPDYESYSTFDTSIYNFRI